MVAHLTNNFEFLLSVINIIIALIVMVYFWKTYKVQFLYKAKKAMVYVAIGFSCIFISSIFYFISNITLLLQFHYIESLFFILALIIMLIGSIKFFNYSSLFKKRG